MLTLPPPELTAIEGVLIAGRPLRRIAATFGTTGAALYRHWVGHIPASALPDSLHAVAPPTAPETTARAHSRPTARLLPRAARLGWAVRGSAYRGSLRALRRPFVVGTAGRQPGACGRCVPAPTRRVRRFET